MSHELNLVDHKGTQKDGAVKTYVRICILTTHLLSRESYELTRAKVFNTQWSSIVKGQSETFAHLTTMGLQQGCTPKKPPQMFSSQHTAKIKSNSDFSYFCSLLLNMRISLDNLWFVLIT